MTFLPKIIRTDYQSRRTRIRQKILRGNSIMGGQLFGSIPKGHQRDFFCLDKYTWVWHEVWTDESGYHSISTRYSVRPNGVFKIQDGGTYQGISGSEARNLMRAAELYRDKVITSYNNLLQTA